MEVVTSTCKQCKFEVGRFRNSWYGIGNTYYSPVYLPLSADGFRATGDVYAAANDSSIKDSLLQDIACEKCGTILGLRCEEAPTDHILKKNQLILRLSIMSILSEASGKKAKISVLKSYALTTKPRNRTETSTEPTTTKEEELEVPAQLTELQERSVNAVETSTTASDIALFKTWADEAIEGQQKDIDRLSGTLGRIERDMKSFKEFMIEMRTHLGLASNASIKSNEEDIATVRHDLASLNEKVSSFQGFVSRQDFEVATQAMTSLSKDVEQVNRRVDDVESVKRGLAEVRSEVKALKAKESCTKSGQSNQVIHRAGQTHTPTNIFDKRGHDHVEESTTDINPSQDAPATKRRKVITGIRPEVPIWGTRVTRRQISTRPSTLQFSLDGADPQENDLHLEQSKSSADPALDTMPPIEADGQSHHFSASTPVVEIRPALPPASLMTLNKGTSLSTNRRNGIAGLTHLEAAIGGKRDEVAEEKHVQNTPSAGYSRSALRSVQSRANQNFRATPAYDDDYVDDYSLDTTERSPTRNRDKENDIIPRTKYRPRTPAARARTEDPDGFGTLSSASRLEREHTTPPFQITEIDPDNLPRPFKCGTCNNQYRTLQALDYHQEHGACEKTSSDNVPEAFKCGSCGRLFLSFTGIKKHVLRKICEVTQEGKNPYLSQYQQVTCQNCGKKWKAGTQFNGHPCTGKRESSKDINDEKAEPPKSEETPMPTPVTSRPRTRASMQI